MKVIYNHSNHIRIKCIQPYKHVTCRNKGGHGSIQIKSYQEGIQGKYFVKKFTLIK